jgi:hypothetical protein
MAGNSHALFTPVFDNLILAVGPIPALVFGLVWRYTHMSDGVCRAACPTLAARLGLDRSTILRALQKLRETGLLEDLTPGLRNRPHVLRPTARSGTDPWDARVSVAESNSDGLDQQVGVAENDNRCSAERHPAVAQSNMNQTLLRDIRKDEELNRGQILFYRERVEYANQNLLTFNRCRAIVHCRFEAVAEGHLVISHPDVNFLSRVDDGFRRLYEKTLAQYLPEGEVRVVFVQRDHP